MPKISSSFKIYQLLKQSSSGALSSPHTCPQWCAVCFVPTLWVRLGELQKWLSAHSLQLLFLQHPSTFWSTFCKKNWVLNEVLHKKVVECCKFCYVRCQKSKSNYFSFSHQNLVLRCIHGFMDIQFTLEKWIQVIPQTRILEVPDIFENSHFVPSWESHSNGSVSRLC